MQAKRFSAIAAAVAVIMMVSCSSESDDSSPATDGSPAETSVSAAPSSAPSATAATPAAATSAAPTTIASSSTPEPTTAPAGADGGITIENFAYAVPTGLKAGTVVTITNADGSDHTFTDKAGSFDVAVSATGGTGQLTVPADGTYEVICRIHPSMAGTLTVG